jgi:hypothetical protein
VQLALFFALNKLKDKWITHGAKVQEDAADKKQNCQQATYGFSPFPRLLINKRWFILLIKPFKRHGK